MKKNKNIRIKKSKDKITYEFKELLVTHHKRRSCPFLKKNTKPLHEQFGKKIVGTIEREVGGDASLDGCALVGRKDKEGG